MKKTKYLLTLSLVSLTLISCEKGTSSYLASSSSSQSVSSSETDSSNSSSSSSSSSSNEEEKYQRTYVDEYLEATGMPRLPSKGNSKILVVPVIFSDMKDLVSEDEITQMREDLNTAFFGESEDTGWESVSSYYEKASYNQVHLNGEISQVYYTPLTASRYASIAKNEPTISTDSILDGIYTEFFTGDNPIYNVSDYDSDEDGIVDSIYMIYYYPAYTGYNGTLPDSFDSTNWESVVRGNSLFWAFTYWDYYHDDLGAYSWSSYFMLKNQDYNGLVDSHTYIHETGHLFGLDDYYNAYPVYGYTSPMGMSTMMDNNVGDLDAYSKNFLGWSNLVDYTDTIHNASGGTYTLRPFEETGDTYIIGIYFPYSPDEDPFYEYLVLEYYTPTGLNEKDASAPYSSGVQCLTESGLKIYHTDSRVSYMNVYNPNQYDFVEHPDFSDMDEAHTYIMPASNTPERSYSGYNLVNLVEAEGTNRLTSYSYYMLPAVNEDMFFEGDSFHEAFPTYRFNSGETLPFDIRVNSISEEGLTFTVSLI